MSTQPSTTRETALELIGMGYTDQRIAEFLCIHPSTVSNYRRKAGQTRSTEDRYKTALPQAEIVQLRVRENVRLKDGPPSRGWCPTCREWLPLAGVLLAPHNRRVVGQMRQASPRCDWSGCLPPADPS